MKTCIQDSQIIVIYFKRIFQYNPNKVITLIPLGLICIGVHLQMYLHNLYNTNTTWIWRIISDTHIQRGIPKLLNSCPPSKHTSSIPRVPTRIRSINLGLTQNLRIPKDTQIVSKHFQIKTKNQNSSPNRYTHRNTYMKSITLIWNPDFKEPNPPECTWKQRNYSKPNHL